MADLFPTAPHGVQVSSHRYWRSGCIALCVFVTLAFLILPAAATAPVASFTATPTSGDVPLTVKFTDRSTPDGNIDSWHWDFGDGSTASTENPSHKYTEAGTYTITLTVENEDGTDDYTRVNYITVEAEKPDADFEADVTGGIAPLTVQFEDLSENDPESWSWTFGDGGTSTEKDPQYTYEDAGKYSVSLKVTNTGGSDTETKSKYITVVAANDPVASFTVDVKSGTAPLTVQFTDTSSYYPDDWYWEFGDGETSDEQNPEHEYEDEGTYTVTLTVSNDEGEDEIEKDDFIVVGDLPVISFTASVTSGTVPLTVQFADTSSYDPDTWYWSFGDGYSSTYENPSHTYSSVGTYSVALTATNDVGSSTATKSSFITVSAVKTTTQTTIATLRTTAKTTATTAPATTATTAAAASGEEDSLFSLPVIGGIVLIVVTIIGVLAWKGSRGGGRWDL